MNIETKIQKYILKELLHEHSRNIGVDDSLISSGILDSLTLLQLISFLEEEFGINIDDTEMQPNNFQTIRIMCSFVEQKLKNT